MDELENKNKSAQKQLQSAQAELRHAAGLRFELEEEKNRSEQMKSTFEQENTTLRKEVSELRANLTNSEDQAKQSLPQVGVETLGDGSRPKFRSASAEIQWQDVEKLQNDFRQEHDELTRMRSELGSCMEQLNVLEASQRKGLPASSASSKNKHEKHKHK